MIIAYRDFREQTKLRRFRAPCHPGHSSIKTTMMTTPGQGDIGFNFLFQWFAANGFQDIRHNLTCIQGWNRNKIKNPDIDEITAKKYKTFSNSIFSSITTL